mgnify:CR=1 FL=1
MGELDYIRMSSDSAKEVTQPAQVSTASEEDKQGLLQITRTLEASVEALSAQVDNFDKEVNSKIDTLFTILKQ